MGAGEPVASMTTVVNEVSEAFEILLEEIEMVAHALQQQGAEAFADGRLQEVKTTLAELDRVVAFRDKVRALQREWSRTVTSTKREPEAGREPPVTRLRRGLRTPEEAFRIPILRALVEMGGRGRAREVLDRIQPMVVHRLTEHDLQPLPTGEIRWRNTAAWCRKDLVEEGLLAADSPHGIWEITDKGRHWLEQNTNET